ncbi:hypothetical protein Q0590_17785 [Rhodocytophaga aerolata]|uniref:Uncharacterized protein n=1 Tax=Rhodocytophaga aerolata TaxID=455078 RepID=A0ABT8R7Q3_9BACT|nr:hypothetical protein [Rhodocytophaga aerolata]MDO1448130.1 hypothetical protein [Rhodocytophaga aerolata]
MNNRILGLLAIVGAPFLLIDYCIHGQNGGGEQFEHTSLSGIFSIIYISAWMCSMVGLKNMYAAGDTKNNNLWILIPIVTLSMANIWNVWETIQPGANTLLYHLLDAFWPISNIVMFFFGIRVIWVKKLQGWKRFVPLLVGLWLPLSIVLSLVAGLTVSSMLISGLYSAFAWAILGYVVFTSKPDNRLAYIPIRVRR